ncbi:hypothetical protein IEQ34_008267 [Dendrobium chrysotoxum]|uniref:Uncharacterized protein n=1 Tax=Dendrobium chrysotoxum TaxID=161865 RepID=A0AAV7H880_DENCH|nr:hypothetical protein IEQ34_008267 [Dendrobium chrysotoxum]
MCPSLDNSPSYASGVSIHNPSVEKFAIFIIPYKNTIKRFTPLAESSSLLNGFASTRINDQSMRASKSAVRYILRRANARTNNFHARLHAGPRRQRSVDCLWAYATSLINVPGGAGAEGNQITSSGGTGERRRGIIIRVAIRSRASVFKKFRVNRRLTSAGSTVLPATAILRRAESIASAPASHRLAGGDHPELRRAKPINIDKATGGSTAAFGLTALRHDEQGEVIAVDEADIEKIHAAASVECELRESGRRSGSAAGAIDGAGAAVGAGAGETAGGGVGGAESAAP